MLYFQGDIDSTLLRKAMFIIETKRMFKKTVLNYLSTVFSSARRTNLPLTANVCLAIL